MGNLGGSHIFFLEKDLGAMLLQLTDGRQAVNRVAGEAAHRLGQNQVGIERLIDTIRLNKNKMHPNAPSFSKLGAFV